MAGGVQVHRRRRRKLQGYLSRCKAPPPRLLGRLPEAAARYKSPFISRHLSLERICRRTSEGNYSHPDFTVCPVPLPVATCLASPDCICHCTRAEALR